MIKGSNFKKTFSGEAGVFPGCSFDGYFHGIPGDRCFHVFPLLVETWQPTQSSLLMVCKAGAISWRVAHRSFSRDCPKRRPLNADPKRYNPTEPYRTALNPGFTDGLTLLFPDESWINHDDSSYLLVAKMCFLLFFLLS